MKVYIVVTEAHYGGSHSVRAFARQEDAEAYLVQLEKDSNLNALVLQTTLVDGPVDHPVT